MKDNNMAYLSITTWVGTAAWGATHYYGKITCGQEKIEVERVLSEKEAAELNASEKETHPISAFQYEAGDKTERFTSEKALIDAAKAQYKELFPQAEFLILGDSYVSQAQPIIAGDMDRLEVKRINEIHEEGESISGWDGSQRKRMRIITDEWRELFKKLIGKPADVVDETDVEVSK